MARPLRSVSELEAGQDRAGALARDKGVERRGGRAETAALQAGPEVKFVGTCAKLPRYKTRTYVESVKTIVVLGKLNRRAPVTAPRFCCPAHPARAVANRASENLGI